MHPSEPTRDTGTCTVKVSVVSVLPEGKPQGTFFEYVESSTTVRSLLRHICKKASVPLDPTYVLHTGERKALSMDNPVLALFDQQQRVTMYWDTSDNMAVPLWRFWNYYWTIGILSALFGCAGLVTVFYLYLHPLDHTQYGIMFDAGYSATSMHIFTWQGQKLDRATTLTEDGSTCKVGDAGLASYVNNTGMAGPSFIPCLDTAKDIISFDRRSSAYLYLGATGGMRLLQKENASASAAIMNSVCTTLGSSQFSLTDKKSHVRILTGQKQAVFSWITSNYVSGFFHTQQSSNMNANQIKSVGALELDGVSTEISFVPNSMGIVPSDNLYTLSLFGTNYTLNAQSFLCFGLVESARRLQAALVQKANYSRNIKNPCLPQGYTLNVPQKDIFSSKCVTGKEQIQTAVFHLSGESNKAACDDLVSKALFNFSVPCLQPPCLDNAFPHPQHVENFYALSSYYDLMEFLNLTSTDHVSYANFQRALKSLCAKDWQQVQRMKTKFPRDLPWYCFQSVFVDNLLVKAYGFSSTSWNKLHFVKSIGGAGWTLGMIISEGTQQPAYIPGRHISTMAFSLFIVLFICFAVLSVFFIPHMRNKEQPDIQLDN